MQLYHPEHWGSPGAAGECLGVDLACGMGLDRQGVILRCETLIYFKGEILPFPAGFHPENRPVGSHDFSEEKHYNSWCILEPLALHVDCI